MIHASERGKHVFMSPICPNYMAVERVIGRDLPHSPIEPREEFGGEIAKGFGAGGGGVVQGDGAGFHGGLGKLDVLGDYGVEEVDALKAFCVAEAGHGLLVIMQVGADAGEGGAEAADLEFEALAKVGETIQEEIEADRGKEIGLHGDEVPIAGVEGVLRAGHEVGGAIADDDVVVRFHFFELAAEDALAAGARGEVEIEEGELEVAGDEVEAGDFLEDVVDDAVLELEGVFVFGIDFEDVGHGAVVVLPFGPSLFGHDAEGGVGLGVEIDEENALVKVAGKIGGDVDGAGGLADSALHVDERDDVCLWHGGAYNAAPAPGSTQKRRRL